MARALGREFVRISLGGLRDEAEIRGHRRTYIGALPGRIVRALRDAGTMNPVILLDEVDKVGADWRGDPSAALLEVLDPAQNNSFRDHYLDVEVDLSEVVFLATANLTDTIPAPLLDRMETIAFDGYTSEEKLAIARGYLLPRQLERNGLEPGEVEVGDDLLKAVISEYTREAGVRQLERELGKLLRGAATRIAAGEAGEGPIALDEAALRDALGRQRFFQESVERTAIPGVSTGLAVTGAGGDVLFIEATAMEGDKGLVLTGQLGDVMKESARIALSYARSHASELGIDPERFQREFHLHVPAGAIPKDGPSAGTAMTTALVSLLSGRPVKHTVGMTGEVTLQGRVLPIGGLKQKVLAAHAAGLTEVILPERNRGDLDEVPEEVREADVLPPGDERRRGARAGARAGRERGGCRRDVVAARRSRASCGRRPGCSSAAGRWRRSTPRPAAPARFNEFRQSLPGVSPTTLSERLDQLEAARIVERHLVAGRPPHTEYVLTPRGKRLASAVAGLLEGAQ